MVRSFLRYRVILKMFITCWWPSVSTPRRLRGVVCIFVVIKGVGEDGFNPKMYPNLHPSAPYMDDDSQYCCCNNNVNRAYPASSCPKCFNRPVGPSHLPQFIPGRPGYRPPPHHPPNCPNCRPNHPCYPPYPPPPGQQYPPPPGPTYPVPPSYTIPPSYPSPTPPSYPTPTPPGYPTPPGRPGYPSPTPLPPSYPSPNPSPPAYRPTPKPRPAHNRPPVDNTAAYYWVDTHARGGLPTTAIRGGHDVDGEPIYVGRAFHEGDWLPAKVIPGKQIAYVCYDGGEHPKHEYQILCEQRFDWVHNHGGFIPPGAVEGGRTSDGETLYIGRVNHEGSVTVGKVHPSHGTLYIPYGGREIGYPDYEILVLRS